MRIKRKSDNLFDSGDGKKAAVLLEKKIKKTDDEFFLKVKVFF